MIQYKQYSFNRTCQNASYQKTYIGLHTYIHSLLNKMAARVLDEDKEIKAQINYKYREQ